MNFYTQCIFTHNLLSSNNLCDIQTENGSLYLIVLHPMEEKCGITSKQILIISEKLYVDLIGKEALQTKTLVKW